MKIISTDSISGITNSAQTFQVTIKCMKSLSLLLNPIASITTYYINPNSLTPTTLTLPQYGPNPSGCSIGALTYQLSSSGTFPLWITQNPTISTNIVIGSKDSTTVGNYAFIITAADPLSGLSNSSVTFTIIMKVIDASSITVSTTPSNQSY